MNVQINELESIDNTVPEPSKLRRGGKQRSGLPSLKHSNFYFQIQTGITTETLTDEIKSQLKELVIKLSEKIEQELLIMEGSEQAYRDFNMPKQISRQDAWLRVQGPPVVKYHIAHGDKTKQAFLFYMFSIARRGLDVQIRNEDIVKYLRLVLSPHVDIKPFIYRDAKKDINTYITKNPII